jgi:hypothetical protein
MDLRFNENTLHKIIMKSLVMFLALISFAITSIAGNTNTKYFGHIVFRETPMAPYKGIYPLSEEQSKKQVHYAFKYDETGRVYEIATRLGSQLVADNGNWDSFIWFAPMVRIEYGDGSETHTYYDASGTQIAAHGNVYSAVYDINESGDRVGLKFYDEAGEPSENAWNIHSYAWDVLGEGKFREKRFGLDGEQRPLRPEFTFYEVILEYDYLGQLAFVRNMGLEGVPTNNESGAGIDRITYDHNGNFIRWQVYDKDGNPVEGNRPMVHLGEHLYDSKGYKVGLRGFDRFGNRIPFSWGVFEHANEFDSFGNEIAQKFYGPGGQLYSKVESAFAKSGLYRTSMKGYGPNGELVRHQMLGGAAVLEFVRDSDGAVTVKRYDPEMNEISE